jgi:polysaccharide export outer membrane protein
MMTAQVPAVFKRWARAAAFAGVFALLLAVANGCRTPAGRAMSADDMIPIPLQLSPGDALEITFPGATNLSGVHRIGPDGTITMPLVGQVAAAGKTSQELQNDLFHLYEKELQDKEVIVGIVGSANIVYVTGAVGKPGRVEMNRPLTAVEAIMEAGGFADTADRKRVKIIRYEGDQNFVYILNLEPLLYGGPVSPFYVRPRDIINVPAKVQWF